MALALPVLLAAILDPRIPPLLERVTEEARVFTERCQKFVGVEKLTQKGRIAPPRFRLRKGAQASEVPAIAYRTTELMSEYGFGRLPGLGGEVKEIRLVTAVNGRPVRDRPAARLQLAEGMDSDMDRLTKQMLQDMEAYGMVGAVTDMGQMLMLFNRTRLGDFDFTMLPDTIRDGEPVAVLTYRQSGGEAATRVYHREVARIPISGELWIRRASGQPLRITAELPLKEGKFAVVHSLSVDYAQSPQGVMLPSRAAYSRRQDSVLMVETEAVYSDFKMFSAEAEIKFLAADEPEK